ncbi:MAG: DUF342 domain-containing protein [FCB group bacterium]|nr:DUF342 domain-containing protein [FCB group bacterium]
MGNQLKSVRERLAAKKAVADLEENIKVHLPKDDSWKVEIYVPFEEMSHNKLTSILRIAKTKISKRDKVPVGLLSYDDLVQKDVMSEGYQITAKIVKCEMETGNPVLRFLNASSEEIEYNDMVLYLDIFPKKFSGEEVKLSDINELLKEAKIDRDNVDVRSVDKAMATVRKDLVVVRSLLLAQGRFPDPSADASLDYIIPFRDYGDGSYIGTDKVAKDQVFLRRTESETGKKDGFNVRQEVLIPRIPTDIELSGAEGVTISADGNEVIAKSPGIPRIREFVGRGDSQLIRFSISIESLETIDGREKIEITSENHIEVSGGLKEGSRIISRGEVFIKGDVEDGTSVSASGNISVSGKIHGGTIISEKDIDGNGDVSGSKLMAHGKLTIHGTATNSNLAGLEVYTDKVVGCKITVGSKSVIDTISPDEEGFTAKITAGMVDHLKEKIKENQEFIDYASHNLEKVEGIVGNEIVNTATPANVSRMTIMHCKILKTKGIVSIPKKQMDALKELIKAIGPIRQTMKDKSKALRLYIKQMESGDQGNPEIYIRNGVEAAVEVEIAGTRGRIEPPSKSVTVTKKGAKVEVTDWKAAEIVDVKTEEKLLSPVAAVNAAKS